MAHTTQPQPSRKPELWKDVYLTPAHLRLLRIMKLAKKLEAQVNSYLDKHGSECKCQFCSSPIAEHCPDRQGDQVERDLIGFSWTLETAISVIGGQTIKLKAADIAEAKARIVANKAARTGEADAPATDVVAKSR